MHSFTDEDTNKVVWGAGDIKKKVRDKKNVQYQVLFDDERYCRKCQLLPTYYSNSIDAISGSWYKS